ncbi:src-like-adapter 2 [Hyla sarda]|uniref:src-like-adapter 2 n=1 Tax=Hyla sarda TaxID=327740 RepID=UPI0024C27507|nr:src-like-adapter 2 [Hyla sarda]XP_056405217.1 src-like-adapter 2 [Hyla sarda]
MGSQPSKRGYSAIAPAMSTTQRSPDVMDKSAFVALYNFPAGGRSDFSIGLGEQLHILSEDGDWWKVKSVSTGRECYMPRNYVATVQNRWFYKGINREKAEELLLISCNRSGSFLIRESDTRRGSYSLSVRKSNQATLDTIKHYRINRLENGWYYISPRLTFPTLQDMVDYYSEMADGICCILKEPCIVQGVVPPAAVTSEPIIVRKTTLNWRDLDSSALFREDTNLNDEDCPVSLGLREAVTSYMFMTEEMDSMAALERERLYKT